MDTRLLVLLFTGCLVTLALGQEVCDPECEKDQTCCNKQCFSGECKCCGDNCYEPVDVVCCYDQMACNPGETCCNRDDSYPWCCDTDSICCPNLWTCCPPDIGCGDLDCGVDRPKGGMPPWVHNLARDRAMKVKRAAPAV